MFVSLPSTNRRFIWSGSEVDKMITRTDPMINMYDEARYVASIHSDEPKLKEEYAQTMESFKHGWSK